MGLQKIVVLCVAVASVGGGVWYFTQGSNGTDSATQIDPPSLELDTGPDDLEEVDKTGMFSGLGSFASLIARGSSFKCEFNSVTPEGEMQGVSYIDGKNERFRMDADGTDESAGFDGNFGMISNEDAIFWWGDTPEGKQGMKITVPEDAESDTMVADPSTLNDSQGAVSMDEEVSYDCSPWRVDESKFIPPSDVDFTDMNAMFEEMMQGVPEGFEMPEGFPISQ